MVTVVQGALTLVGLLIGDILAAGYVAAITAVGGLLWSGSHCGCCGSATARRRSVASAAVAPALVAVVSALRG